MSKKILKRSLALGALMAFVITGSAMAASGVISNKIVDGKIVGTGTLNVTVSGTDQGLQLGSSTGPVSEKVVISGFDSIVLDGSNSVHKNTFNAYAGTELIIENVGSIYSADSSDLTNTTIFHAQKGNVTINNVKEISLIGVGNEFMAQGGGVLTVNADSVSVIANNGNALQCSYFQEDSSITINADNLSLVSTTAAGISSMGGDVVADVTENIYVEGSNGVNANYGGTVSLEAKNITVKNNGSRNAVRAANGGSVSINGANSVIVNGNVYAEGNNSEISIDGGASTVINGAVNVGTYNAHDGKIDVNLKGKDITIDSGASYGVVAWGAQGTLDDAITVNLGDDKTENVTIKNFTYAGVLAGYDESVVKVNADKFEVTGKGTGIWAANGTCATDELTNNDDNDSAKSSIVISERTDTIINVDENAICAMSDGVVDIKGNLYAKSEEVIVARGGATVNINNENKNKVVELIGDIAFNYNGETSGTPVDANININLTNADSFFTGKIGITGKNIPDGYDEVNSMNIKVTNGAQWNLTGASIVNHAEFGKDSVLNLETGSDFTGDVYALNASGSGDNSLKVDQDAKLQIGGIKETTYNIAAGFENYDAVKGWTEITDNALMEANKVIDQSNKTLQVEIKTKEAEQMATEMGISNSTAQSVANVTAAAQAAIDGGAVAEPEGTGNDKAVALVQAMANANPQAAGQAFEAVSKMAEAGGNSGTAASIVKNVTGVTNDRLSFNCGHSAPHKGGHGVGLFEEGSGADVWVEYVHGKDKVEDMPSSAGATSYEGQYNGIVMGVDFKKVNKFQSGFAFNYGEGDTNSVGSAARTHSDYDFWGIGYYGSIHNDDSNVIFDIGYAKTDSDVETKALGMTYNASPETTTWTAGVKVEKLYQNENVQIVPYTGLRFMSIDPEDYSTKCASSKYQMERQNVWLLPLGVSIKQEVTNDNGWTVSPKVDLSYIWAFGDTDSEMEFSTLGTKTNIGYEVMDDGSFLGLVGIEAHKGQWGFGVSYSYQKGDYSTSKKWFIDANYSF